MADFIDHFKSAVERNKAGIDERETFRSKLKPYGVKFLDECTGGLACDDLVLLLAYTGIGKTMLAVLMAAQAAMKNERVIYFALEAHENEIEWRLKYREIANLYYASEDNRRTTLTYRNWIFKDGPDVSKFEIPADRMFELKYSTLRTVYPTAGLTSKGFEKCIETITNHADEVFIDHLHYFDIDSLNENKGLTDTMKTIRHSVLVSRVPHVLVCHLRKDPMGGSKILPMIDDIHGSSNISKIATVVIAIGRAPDDCSSLIVPTYFRVLKYRRDGSVMANTARLMFDVKKNQYEDNYELGKLTADGFEKLPYGENPYWAKSAF
jgi:hypothetical protein